MAAKGKGGSVLSCDALGSGIRLEEAVHHCKCLCCGHDCRVRIGLQEVLDICGVIRLHVLDDQIVRLPAAENGGDVVQPFMGKMNVNCIHNGCFLVHDHIGIIGHSIGNHILAFKKVYLMVVYTHIFDRISNSIHMFSPPRKYYGKVRG